MVIAQNIPSILHFNLYSVEKKIFERPPFLGKYKALVLKVFPVTNRIEYYIETKETPDSIRPPAIHLSFEEAIEEYNSIL